MVVLGSTWRAAICTSRRLTPASSMVVTKMPQHVRVHPRHPDPGGAGQVPKPAGGGVPVHPAAKSVA
jgi:hypothetical protein